MTGGIAKLKINPNASYTPGYPNAANSSNTINS